MTDITWLDPDEQVLWSDKPNAVRLTLKRGAGPFLMGLFFLPISIGMLDISCSVTGLSREMGRKDQVADYTFVFTGVLFSIVAISSMLWPIWIFLRARRTTYALTTRRAVTDVAGMYSRRISLPLGQLRFVELRSSSDRVGDVIFNEATRPSLDGWGPRADGFVAITGAADVEQLLRTTIARSREIASGDHLP